MACRPAGVVVQGRSLAQSWVSWGERLYWICCTSHLLQGVPDAGGQFRGASVDWYGLQSPVVLLCPVLHR
jgi:hypothetical protein